MLRMSKPGGAVNIYFGVNSHQCLGNLSVVSENAGVHANVHNVHVNDAQVVRSPSQ